MKRNLILTVLFIFAVFSCPVFGENLTQSFSHKLSIGEQSNTWEHRIDLPAAQNMRGRIFNGRTLSLDGKLQIVAEELTPTYYYIKVRLVKATLWFAKGTVDVTLNIGDAPANYPVLDSPSRLKIYGNNGLSFYWEGTGDYSAISLLENNTAKTLWERVIVGKDTCDLSEVHLTVPNHYTWAVKQSDGTGRYSKEAQSRFRMEYQKKPCVRCHGSGQIQCSRCNGSGHILVQNANGQTVSTTCPNCHGWGKERCPDCFGQGTITVSVAVPE